MTLLNPLGLLGLLSLPLIVALHMLRERKRRYIVSNLSLWAFLESESRAPRFRRIPINRLLLLDLLIAALLSLAWAQPALALNRPNDGPRHTVILIDVSTSMRAQSGMGDRLSQAKTIAGTLYENAGPQDVVTVVTFGSRAALLADSREDGMAVLADRVAALRGGETGSTLQEALALGQAALGPDLPAEFYVITDGNFELADGPAAGGAAAPDDGGAQGAEAAAQAAAQRAVVDFAYPLRWRFVGQPSGNQAVVALTVTQVSEQAVQVFARFANFSGGHASREAVLKVDGREVDRSLVNIPADSSVARVWQAAVRQGEGLHAVTITLEGSDSLAEDDSASIGLQAVSETRVALVAENPALLQQAVRAVPGAVLTVIPPRDYHHVLNGETAPFDLTIFRGFLPEAWPGGRVLVVEPPQFGGENDSALAPGAEALRAVAGQAIPGGTAVRSPNPSLLVEGIDFSSVRWGRAWALSTLPPGFVTLLQAGDTPLLIEGRTGPNGNAARLTVLLADLARGNFTRHPAFPILMANLVDSARQAPLPPSLKTGEALALPISPASGDGIPITGGVERIDVISPRGEEARLVAGTAAEWRETLDPGLYRFRVVQRDGEAAEYAAGINAGDPAESDLRPRAWTEAALAPRGANTGAAQQEEQPLDLRPWLLGAAILALLMEALPAWRR